MLLFLSLSERTLLWVTRFWLRVPHFNGSRWLKRQRVRTSSNPLLVVEGLNPDLAPQLIREILYGT